MSTSSGFASIVRAVQAAHVPGAIGALTKGGSTEVVTAGRADLASNEEPDHRTLFRAYSVAKPFTALAVARLTLVGALDLDRPVNEVLDHLQVVDRDGARVPVTLRHLLSHTASLRVDHDLYVSTATSYLELAGDRVTCESSPPAEWAYSNDCYGVAQQVLEDVTGEPFVDHLNGLMGDVGVEDGGFSATPRKEGAATPYDRDEDGSWQATADVLPSVIAAGALWLSARDLASLTATLLAPEATWLREAIAITSEPQAVMPFPELRQCLGWMRRSLDDVDYLWHSGAGKGGYAELWIGPSIALAFCANGSTDVGQIAIDVLESA